MSWRQYFSPALQSGTDDVPVIPGAVLWPVALTALLFLSGGFASYRLFDDPAHYSALHTFLEFIAMTIAAMIFGLAWNLAHIRNNNHTVLLSTGFLATCLLDFLHTLSFVGMPMLVTPSGHEKAINFWLVARYLESATLLAVALLPLRHWSLLRCRLLVAGGLGLTIALAGAILVYEQYLPATYVAGLGLTEFKIVAEYGLIALFGLTTVILFVQGRRSRTPAWDWLAAAAWTQGLAEVFFTGYADVTDISHVLGHVYKAAAYLMVYRAIFVSRVRAPYIELETEKAYLRTLIDTLPAMVWLKDRNGVYLGCNRRFERFAGRSEAEVVGKTDYDLVDRELADWFRENDRLAMEMGRPRINEEMLRFADDGHFELVETIKAPMQRPDGTLIGVLGMAHDITERKKAEAELQSYRQHLQELVDQRTADLQAAKQEAERANNAKSRFLAAASHDLRQPLGALSLYVGVLRGVVQPKGLPLVNDIRGCVGTLNELLTDLLDVSKLEAGVVEPRLSAFAINEVFSKLLSLHVPEAQLKGLKLRSLPSPVIGYTDQVLFSRMLGNLVSNAIRYTQKGGVLLACRRHRGKQWIEVWDTGIGIPNDKTTDIFEEFIQLGDGARNRGTGLGLAIVAKIAALLRLEIRVRSRLGRGSLFAVELPLGHAVAEPPRPTPALAPVAMRIALVEDNVSVLNALSHALTAVGHEVVAAAGGSELIERLAGVAPGLVISDFRLRGDENGFAIIADVRHRFGEHLPAIILTGDTDPNLIASMVQRGILILHKPVELEALQAYIAEAIRVSTSTHEPAMA